MITATRKPAPIASINITNLVDVCMVLLIIFILVAPQINQGMDVDTPKSEGLQPLQSDRNILIAISKEGAFFFQNVLMDSIEQLGAAAKEEYSKDPKVPVYIKCDRTQSVESLYAVMGQIRVSCPDAKIGLIGAPKGSIQDADKKALIKPSVKPDAKPANKDSKPAN